MKWVGYLYKQFKKHSLLLMILCLAGIAYNRYGTASRAAPAYGDELTLPPNDSPKPPVKDTIRVATFNIHSGKGMDGRIDLERIAKVISNVDLVGLNEISRSGFFGKDSQTELLGNMLNMPWVYAPAEMKWGRGDFGNAALCTFPVESWIRIPLSSEISDAARSCLLLRVKHPKGLINVIITHIAPFEGVPSQLSSVIDLFLSVKKPAILMGDMNSYYATCPMIKELLEMPDVHNAVEQTKGKRYKDWIFVRGLEVVDSKVVPRFASDHPTLFAELAWPQPSPKGSDANTNTAGNESHAHYRSVAKRGVFHAPIQGQP